MELFPVLLFKLVSSNFLPKKLGLNVRIKHDLGDLKSRCSWEDNISVGLRLCVKLVA